MALLVRALCSAAQVVPMISTMRNRLRCGGAELHPWPDVTDIARQVVVSARYHLDDAFRIAMNPAAARK